MSTRYQRAKKARKGDRSFQPSSNGKGDQDRTTDREAFNRNYDEINWGPGKRPKFRPIIYIREKKETPSLMTNVLTGPCMAGTGQQCFCKHCLDADDRFS